MDTPDLLECTATSGVSSVDCTADSPASEAPIASPASEARGAIGTYVPPAPDLPKPPSVDVPLQQGLWAIHNNHVVMATEAPATEDCEARKGVDVYLYGLEDQTACIAPTFVGEDNQALLRKLADIQKTEAHHHDSMENFTFD